MSRAERLNTLEQLVKTQPRRKWRTRELADALNVSEDTISRDLRDLSRTGKLPLITNGSTAGFTWELDPDYQTRLEPLHLGYADGAALYAAARLLWQQQDERNDAVRRALLRLIAILPEPVRAHLEAVVAEQPTEASTPDTTAIFSVLCQGWLSGHMVELTYDPPNKRLYSCRFAPYLLEPSGIGHTLYFIGHSDPPGALRTYKLERIRAATLTEDAFTVPSDFNGVALLQRAWGVMYGGEQPVHVKLRFSQYVSRRVRETTWHASQTLTDTPDGLIWEADIGDITEIRPWIRGWGADCEVLEPVELRDGMIQEARRLAFTYGIAETSSNSEEDHSLFSDLFSEEK
ncbi:MAG: helix-turn-helix transcriptional regulator [Sciscionella sp.]